METEAKKGSAWSADEDAALIKMASEGWQNPMISNAIPGRSVSSVKSRKEYLGLTAQDTWTDEEDALLTKLHGTDLPWRTISDRVGRNKNACIGRAFRLGLPHRGHKHVAAVKKTNAPLKFKIKQHESESISLIETNKRTCMWPVSEDPTADVGHRIKFCGAKIPLGISLCLRHAGMAYTAKGLEIYNQRAAKAVIEDEKRQLRYADQEAA